MRVAPLLKTANCRHRTLYRRRRVMHLTRVCVKSVAVVRTTRVTVATKLAAAQHNEVAPGKTTHFRLQRLISRIILRRPTRRSLRPRATLLNHDL